MQTCPEGPDPRLHRYEAGVYPAHCQDCGYTHPYNPPTGQPRPIGRFIHPDEAADIGLLLGAALVGAF